MLSLLGERNQRNSYFKHIVALYLYATGASRQAISVAAHLGFSSSYPTIAAGGGNALDPLANDDATAVAAVAQSSLRTNEDGTVTGSSAMNMAGPIQDRLEHDELAQDQNCTDEEENVGSEGDEEIVSESDPGSDTSSEQVIDGLSAVGLGDLAKDSDNDESEEDVPLSNVCSQTMHRRWNHELTSYT